MIQVTTNEVEKEETNFPKLAKFTYTSGNSCILLMSSSKKGIVLRVDIDKENKSICNDKVGELWDNIKTYPECFTDYNEPLTIQNV